MLPPDINQFHPSKGGSVPQHPAKTRVSQAHAEDTVTKAHLLNRIFSTRGQAIGPAVLERCIHIATEKTHAVQGTFNTQAHPCMVTSAWG